MLLLHYDTLNIRHLAREVVNVTGFNYNFTKEVFRKYGMKYSLLIAASITSIVITVCHVSILIIKTRQQQSIGGYVS